MTGSTRGQQKVKGNWWDIRERLGSEILSEVVDDSTNSEPGTMKGHITHVGKDVGVIRGFDGAEYSFDSGHTRQPPWQIRKMGRAMGGVIPSRGRQGYSDRHTQSRGYVQGNHTGRE